MPTKHGQTHNTLSKFWTAAAAAAAINININV